MIGLLLAITILTYDDMPERYVTEKSTVTQKDVVYRYVPATTEQRIEKAIAEEIDRTAREYRTEMDAYKKKTGITYDIPMPENRIMSIRKEAEKTLNLEAK